VFCFWFHYTTFWAVGLSIMHAHCTEKWESLSLQQVQCDNELLNDTIKAHCSHIIITELLTCDVPIVTCLGVKIDAELTFSTQVKQVAAGCFYQLRQLWSIRPAVTSDNAIGLILIHALIASRVDYCSLTVFYSRPLPYTSALYTVYSRWWTPQRAWLWKRGSSTALRRLCVTLYIGSWFEIE